MRLPAVWYDVGYDIQNLNMAVHVLQNLDIFWAMYALRSCFLYDSGRKPHSNHVFFRFNHSILGFSSPLIHLKVL